MTLNKTSFISGDFNIDLLKCDSHRGTNNCFNLMFSLDMYRLIIKPTRISNVSATLIDNIFTNDINRDITSGLLITDISDHLPVFAVCKYDCNLYNRSGRARYISGPARYISGPTRYISGPARYISGPVRYKWLGTIYQWRGTISVARHDISVARHDISVALHDISVALHDISVKHVLKILVH